jgi:hypothetical protein
LLRGSNAFDHFRQGVHQTIESLEEGWFALRRRAARALVHFAARPDRSDPVAAETAA